MSWKNILLSGSITGGLIGFLMILNVMSGVTEFGFGIAMLSFLAVILIPAFLVKRTFPQIIEGEASLKHLIPISFLTFILPILGPAFGGGDMGLDWLILVPMGAVGGIFWSLPFAGWSYYKSR